MEPPCGESSARCIGYSAVSGFQAACWGLATGGLATRGAAPTGAPCLAYLLTIHSATRPMMPSTATPPMIEPAIKPALGLLLLPPEAVVIVVGEAVGRVIRGLSPGGIEPATAALLVGTDAEFDVTSGADVATDTICEREPPIHHPPPLTNSPRRWTRNVIRFS